MTREEGGNRCFEASGVYQWNSVQLYPPFATIPPLDKVQLKVDYGFFEPISKLCVIFVLKRFPSWPKTVQNTQFLKGNLQIYLPFPKISRLRRAPCVINYYLSPTRATIPPLCKDSKRGKGGYSCMEFHWLLLLFFQKLWISKQVKMKLIIFKILLFGQHNSVRKIKNILSS